MDFLLSSKCLKQITEAGVEKDFSIKIFDETIKCSVFVAIFLSKKVAKLYLNDRTIREYYVNFPTKSFFYSSIDELKRKLERTKFIDEIKRLTEGSAIRISSRSSAESTGDKGNKEDIERAQILLEFGKTIENEEIVESSLRVIMKDEGGEMTLEEAINRVLLYRHLGVEMSENSLSKEYDVISSNFYSLKSAFDENKDILDKMKEMSRCDLEHIILSEKLRIESEDDLFEIIKELGSDKCFLLSFVEMQFLSVDKVCELIGLINEYELHISGQLWSSICRRLTIDVSQINKTENPRAKCQNSNKCTSTNVNCGNGIFKHLQKTPKENFLISHNILTFICII